MRKTVLACLLFIGFGALPLGARKAAPPAAATAATAPPTQAAPPDMLVGPVHENLVYGVANGETLLLDVFEPADNTGLPRPGIL